MPFESEIRRALAELERSGLLRNPPPISGPQGPEVSIDGRPTLCLCSNNYLGLANHPAIAAAVQASLRVDGLGSAASRLITGTMDAHREAEAAFADFLGTPAAALFSTGYAANLGTVQAVVGPGDVIFSDALNHASLIDGCRLSRARVQVFSHRSADHLESLLRQHRHAAKRALIITDSLFSMDGDIADVRGLCDLAAQYGAHVYIDEAHAVGVIGASGRGVCFEQGVHDQVAVRVGTCGKALGSFGAFVVGSQVLCDFLYNRARSFIYSTSLPPVVIAATSAAIELASADVLRDKLWTNLRWLHGRLGAHTSLSGPPSPIFPIMVGDNAAALSLSADLDTHGFFVQAIRPPTVPVGTARLRLTVSAAHELSTLSRFADALEASMVRLNLVPSAWP